MAGALRRARGRGVLQAPIAERQLAIAALRQPAVMGDQNHRRAIGVRQRQKQRHNLGAGALVQIAGRLIGQNHRRLGDDCARKRHPLLLAAGQLRRIMPGPRPEPDLLQQRAGAALGIGGGGKIERQRHIFQRGHGGNEMKGLKHDSDMITAKARQSRFAERGDGDRLRRPIGARGSIVFLPVGARAAMKHHSALARHFNARQHHQKRAFARTRRAQQPDGFAPLDRQGDILQYGQPPRRTGEMQRDIVRRQDGRNGHRGRFGGLGRFKGCSERAMDDMQDLAYHSRSAATRPRPQARRLGGWLLAFCCYALLAANPSRGQDAPLTLFVLGDSLTAGYDLPQRDGFVAQLQSALTKAGHNVRVLNGSVSGDTSMAALARLNWVLPRELDAVIVELGGNDMLRGVPPSETRKAMEEIVRQLSARKLPVLLAGMLAAPNMGRIYGDAFNEIFPMLAQKYGLLYYPFFLDGVHDQPALKLEDELHPNAAGIRVIVERILPQVELLLARAQSLP